MAPIPESVFDSGIDLHGPLLPWDMSRSLSVLLDPALQKQSPFSSRGNRSQRFKQTCQALTRPPELGPLAAAGPEHRGGAAPLPLRRLTSCEEE